MEDKIEISLSFLEMIISGNIEEAFSKYIHIYFKLFRKMKKLWFTLN